MGYSPTLLWLDHRLAPFSLIKGLTMPEGRMLKKVISESKSLGNLSSDSARLLYTWLIPFLDVEGRHSADPEIIKGHIFPKVKTMTNGKIARLLDDLVVARLILLYRIDGETYLQFTKFKQHQQLNPEREAPSRIPGPDNSGVSPDNSVLSKVNESKVNESKVKAENTGQLFEEFWANYPREGRFHKAACLVRFTSLVKAGHLDDLKAGFAGYLGFLKHKELNENFKQQPLHVMTFLNKERYMTFKGYKYEPRL
jgi:hypothetical protein